MNVSPHLEGSSLLYDGLRHKMIVGQNPRRIENNPNKIHQGIGYFAYPNPYLKNEIPDARFYEYDQLIKKRGLLPELSGFYSTAGRLEQSVIKSQYIKKIHRIKELLAAGEVYQITYAIRFRKKFRGDSYALFYRWMKNNPASFAAYMNGGDFHILSASPERLFRVKNNLIMTQPIKGTAPKKDGKKALQYLLTSEKERAELDMITDLERNDIGKICEYGTLKLKKERALMELPNLWHTYSEIEGRLKSDIRPMEIVDALFPGGSITGCPKIRAMEYIEKLEGLPRNIFTGSIGYISDCRPNGGPNCGTSEGRVIHNKVHKMAHNWESDFNIAIRTALIYKGYVEYWAGGGIVADSDPEKEYEECILKAEKFLSLL